MKREDIKALVADDMAGMRKFVGSKLTEIGITQIEYAEDGQMAWEILSKNPEGFNLIVSDINMPNMNGIDLLKNVRAHSTLKSIYFLIITAEIELTTMSEVIQAGVSEYLLKPFETHDLEKKLNKLLDSETIGQFSLENFIERFNNNITKVISSQCSTQVQNTGQKLLKTGEQLESLDRNCFFSMASCSSGTIKTSLTLHFTEQVYLQYISAMFNTSIDEIEDDMHDIISEFMNIALGHVKGELNDELGLSFVNSIPTSLSGYKMGFSNSSDQDIIISEFNSALGPFALIVQNTETPLIPWSSLT